MQLYWLVATYMTVVGTKSKGEVEYTETTQIDTPAGSIDERAVAGARSIRTGVTIYLLNLSVNSFDVE